MTLPKNDIDFNEYEMDEIKNMDEEEKKEIVDQMLDKIYPKRGINRCMQIKPKNKIHLRNILKVLNSLWMIIKIKLRLNMKLINKIQLIKMKMKDINQLIPILPKLIIIQMNQNQLIIIQKL